ncbi:MAG: hypothetical protein UX74_C0009G0013 [Parcubacteria group bacterium GW2011_GWA2_47_10b]|nr:MAG: hypothetical protein UX74_C0009G0013 [Parcubacteria group bacterium GW2011_GWA2_47_10b]
MAGSGQPAGITGQPTECRSGVVHPAYGLSRIGVLIPIFLEGAGRSYPIFV